jgi:hypothetical protein
MASKMAADTFKWPQLRNYSLKFDDLDVYPQVLGGKEHIKTTLDITELLYLDESELMAFSCPLSPNAQTPLSIEKVSERSVLSVILLLSINQPLECCLDCHSFQFGKGYIQQCRGVHRV